MTANSDETLQVFDESICVVQRFGYGFLFGFARRKGD